MTRILEQVLYPAVDAIRDTVKGGEHLRKAPDAGLYAAGAPLDSLGLVTFVVEVEERVLQEFGTTVRLVSPNAMSRRHSPFRTLGTLAEYIDELLKAAS